MLAQPVGAVEALQRPRRRAHERVARAPPVGDVQAPAGTQHAHRLGQRGALGVGFEVVQQQRHDDAVGAAPGSGSAVASPLRHCTASAPAFARASESTSGSPSTPTTSAPRRGQRYGQRPRSAADIDHAAAAEPVEHLRAQAPRNVASRMVSATTVS